MANLLKALARTLVANAATAYVTAAAAHTITIKRIRVLNTNASGGATVNVSLWAGGAATDAYAICKAIPLGPGEALEMDTTTIVLEAGQSLYALGSITNNLTLHADGLDQG